MQDMLQGTATQSSSHRQYLPSFPFISILYLIIYLMITFRAAFLSRNNENLFLAPRVYDWSSIGRLLNSVEFWFFLGKTKIAILITALANTHHTLSCRSHAIRRLQAPKYLIFANSKRKTFCTTPCDDNAPTSSKHDPTVSKVIRKLKFSFSHNFFSVLKSAYSREQAKISERDTYHTFPSEISYQANCG